MLRVDLILEKSIASCVYFLHWKKEMITESLPLQSIRFQEEGKIHLSALEKETYLFLKGQKIQIDEILDSRDLWQVPLSDDKVIQNWKTLLHLALLGHLSGSALSLLSHQTHVFLHQPWNAQSQYLRAIVALSQFLVGLPALEVNPHLLENGAAPIELQEYCPWQSLPYNPYQAEFGTLLCLLAHLTKQDNLKADVLRLAKWQLNLLDAHFFPLNGLFTQERSGKMADHLLWNYLLFKSVAVLLEDKSFEGAAQAQLKHLKSLPNQEAIPSFFLLLEKMIQGSLSPEAVSHPLPEQIYDFSTSLVGYRQLDSHAICTLHGGHTGLGCFRSHDVQILNYGPQYFPLEDCRGFGIEGNYLSDHGMRQSYIQLYPQGFSLRGCVRLVDQPSQQASSFEMGQFRGIWMEVEQEYRDQQLKLNTHFLGFNGWDAVAFSFFVKAQRCHLNGTTTIHPRTLGRYEGGIQTIALEGQKSSIILNSSFAGGTMQVIPLGGQNNFWGADFLIAYLLDSKERHYQWTVSIK